MLYPSFFGREYFLILGFLIFFPGVWQSLMLCSFWHFPCMIRFSPVDVLRFFNSYIFSSCNREAAFNTLFLNWKLTKFSLVLLIVPASVSYFYFPCQSLSSSFHTAFDDAHYTSKKMINPFMHHVVKCQHYACKG